MRCFDVFHGDADGLCALHQLRMAEPVEADCYTGVKSDIELLAQVPAQRGDRVTVLDIAVDPNRAALDAMLARGVSVRWFDHHYCADLPRHPALELVVDVTGARCTSVLVDQHLRGRHRAWAAAGAFGDGQEDAGVALCEALGLGIERTAALRELGATINYNAYALCEDEVLRAPAELYRIASRYRDPLELLWEEPALQALSSARMDDIARAQSLEPHLRLRHADAWLLPDAPWSRRVRGAYANHLQRLWPTMAHAVIVPGDGGYMVSVRPPRGSPRSAVELCRLFPSGGGRLGAAGIHRLPLDRLGDFVAAFARAFSPATRYERCAEAA